MRTMGIEALLKWAYTDELPKERTFLDLQTRDDGMAPGFLRLTKAGATGAVINTPNQYGILPNPHSIEPPHPDAVTVALAVEGLSTMMVDMPDGWDVFEDVTDEEAHRLASFRAVKAFESLTTRDHAGRRVPTPARVERLLVKHAVLGGAPEWEMVPFEVSTLRKNGQPAWFVRVVVGEGREAYETEIDGFDQKRRIPKPDAFQKRVLDPDLFEVALGRVEHEIWHSALGILAAELNEVLETIRVTPTIRSARPWVEGDRTARIVLRDLTPPPEPARKKNRAKAA